MFEKLLEEVTGAMSTTKKADFDAFNDEIDKATTWLTCRNTNLELKYMPRKAGETTALTGWCYSSVDVLSKFEETGGLYLVIGIDEPQPIRIPVNATTTPFTMDDRAGVRSKLLADFFNKGLTEDYVELINRGFQFYNDKVKILVRGGYVQAIHTGKYYTFSHEDLFGIADKHMKNYAGSKFIKASYTNERTTADYAVCGSKDTFFAKYADAWKTAGLPEKLLNMSFPVLTFSTGDTGKFPVSITPKLFIGDGVFPLGTALSIKHTSSLTPTALEEKAKLAFANLQEGLISIEDMIKLQLCHPYAVFVKAATKVGITAKAKAAISVVLENFKDNYVQGVDDITAFDIYYSICEMIHFREFQELSDPTKLQVMESFNRLLQIRWKELDFSGREEF